MELKYSVDEESGIIVCYLTEAQQLAAITNDLHKATKSTIGCDCGWFEWDVMDLMRKWRYQLTKSVGKAVCSPEDTFDEEVGKEIAKERCLKKFYDKRRKIFDLAEKEISRQAMMVRFKK